MGDVATDELSDNSFIDPCNQASPKTAMAFIDVEEFTGKNFELRQDEDTTSKIIYADTLRNYKKDTKQNAVHI